ncbi:hypothetical protein BBK36DRAFT_1122469 [Trichoderma citrinoviride]|uniref:Uncharacterized protein n=1 Tax=Trichoderma citrinoviride TaxID=58853 RepID=A0A2T4B727_9HYPO|nr:hypothetical protein BBK36DRAFT_1122469 [Trichoderma citrinoviride]PTB65127.1 hypothetical protein BBK36DRAFT_1122469 [Trichoderma citrinoviride]
MSHSGGRLTDSGELPHLGAYHQIVSTRRKPVPVPARAGPYHQGIDVEEEEYPSVPRLYESHEGGVADSADSGHRSKTPPKWPRNSHPALWAPIWLSRVALVAFASTFLLMLLATALLYHFSEENSGLSVQEEANHYAWKYGPTAVLVVVGALWRQVDFANKILMPWEELRTGPSSADKTLLLDYISPLLPTVFSTGLLILEPTQMAKSNQKFQLSSKFQLNQSVDPTFAWAVGPGPAQTYYGINFYGLRYPPGTAEDFIVPDFKVPSMAASNIEYSMSTDGAKVGYDCELLPITNGTKAYMPWRSILASYIVANVTTKDCDIKGVTLAAGPDHYFYHDKNATQNYQAQFVVYPCNFDFDFSRQYIQQGNLSMDMKVYNTSRDLRLFMSVVDLRISPWNASSSGPRYMYLHNVTAALCKPSYELGRFEVGVPNADNGSARALFSASAKQSALKQFPHGSLTMAVDTTVGNWILGNGGVDYVLTATVPTFFQLMSKKAGVESIRSFMDPELLIKTGTDVFKGIAAQVLHSIIVQPANRTTMGSIRYEEQRLRVKALSTGFMCSFLGLLVLISVAMIFTRPGFAAPDRPGAALSMATLLASSPPLNEILSYMGSLSNEKLQQNLGAYYFRTANASDPGTGVSIEPVQRNEAQTVSHPTGQAQSQVPSWKPMASTTWFLVLAICLPLAMIASLEVVQHFSDVGEGFVSINHSSSIVLATYIPSAVALGVASLYAAMQMMAATFAPFAPLKRGKAGAETTISLSLVGQLFPRAFYLSLRSKNFAVAFALFGTFLGSFLSIIVSGLYSSISVPIVKNMTLYQSDRFNFDDANISLDDNEAAAIDNLIEYLGLNSTRWISDDLVFNTFNQDAVISTNSSENVPLQVNIPAVRASLNCTSIPNEGRQVTIFNQEASSAIEFVLPGQSEIVTPQPGYVWVGVNTTMRPADWCEAVPQGMQREEPWMQYFLLPNDTSMAYVGKGSIMTWSGGIVGGDGALSTNPSEGILGDAITETDNGCPTFTVTLGRMRLKKSGKGSKAKISGFEQDLATIVCYQNIEQVMANVTWQLPQFSLDPAQPPETDERTAKFLRSKRGSERFPFLPNAWLNGLTNPLFNQTVAGPNNSDPAHNHIDNFIEALVFSKGGRPVTELAGAKNVANLKNATQQLYGVYMAQAISLNMRDNSTDGDGASLPTYEGVVTTSGHQRLQQNRGPKIALQVVLAVMVACGIATRLLLPVRDVLPHDPCSIAGTATLMAGGELVARLASSMAEWDGQTSAEVLLANGLFSLKWWRDEKGMERYGIDLEPS